MSNSVRFAKRCPTCGRTLQIPVDMIGKEVCCHGCGASFHATMLETAPKLNIYEGIDERVDRLIQAADQQLQQISPT
jgi:transcription elongation factor Elf1